ncbi:hypothetical protein AUEXF2481DRAFT_8282 [Aureobasidium subglaciale EXF-2481]|uniref:Histidine kinase n=1 Tax=Aureobasidium subglaciale (strain EXF-2481) TaxID=1043005 RepID=A0A074YCG8_AURSE|nr:uncharacterized protein AUEXF2481DRAFT_8282 [Aureobasidium subglaciale EXF-2481]KEQ91832.1 hypothetical protein AUEXF2481DRAFT_8282 [Aureobasidium subglaciale EXF-2481]
MAAFRNRMESEPVNTDELIIDDSRFIVRDMGSLDQYKELTRVAGELHMVSCAVVPIKTASGQVLGTYTVMDNKLREDFFQADIIDILSDIAQAINTFLVLHLSVDRFDDYTVPVGIEYASSSPSSSHYEHSLSGHATSYEQTPMTTFSELSGFAFPRQEVACNSRLEAQYRPTSSTPSTSHGCHKSEQAFSKAAQQICAAVDLAELAFVDYSESRGPLSLCEILGYSGNQTSLALHDTSLKYLTQHYAQGCTFSASGTNTSVTTDQPAYATKDNSSQLLDVTAGLPADLRALVHKRGSLIFLPLWDRSASCLYAGMLGWSRNPTDTSTTRNMACLSAFGKVFMMELEYLEALDMAETKSDFVSSISHELRSPLHGCLAAVEFLQDTVIDDSQAELVGMIQACSSTLLDTLNHLLDFSKVNELKGAKSRARGLSTDSKLEQAQNVFGSTTKEYLCTLVQDVVEGVHFGRSTQQAAYTKARTTTTNKFSGASHPSNPALFIDSTRDASISSLDESTDVVAVYLDMQNHSGWCTTLSAGAWKRIVMNLIANSLKYTEKGYIEVSLQLIEDKNSSKRTVHLMISDTGIGMSDDYQRHHLYQPFVQENHLVTGVGLGLSIVKQIVDDLKGTITVKSKKGAGTRIDVYAPLCERDSRLQNTVPSGGEILDSKGQLRGLTLCLLSPSNGANRYTDAQIQRISVMHSYIRSIAQGWFGMEVIDAHTRAEVKADIYIAEGLRFDEDEHNDPDASPTDNNQQPTILVGPLPANISEGPGSPHNITRLAYPLGPKALHRALFAALEKPVEVDQSRMTILTNSESEATYGETTSVPDYMAIREKPSSPIYEASDVQTELFAAPEHVLLVDDNAINLKLLAAYVKKLGHTAELAIDGEDALLKYKAAFSSHNTNPNDTTSAPSAPFSKILMDISMPKMNGFESTRAIREFERHKGIFPPARIIALTGLGSKTSKLEAKICGMDDFRTKPVKLGTLRELLGA